MLKYSATLINQVKSCGFLFAFALIFGGLANRVHAIESCSYAYYTPEAVFAQLRSRLPATGISVLPPGITFTNVAQFPGFVASGSALLRQSFIVGQLAFAAVPEKQDSELTITNVDGKPLFHLVEETHACPDGYAPGLCRRISLTTALEPQRDADMPYSLISTNAGYFYTRYGAVTNPTAWRTDFENAIEYVLADMNQTPLQLPAIAESYEQQLLLHLAADSMVTPYLSQIKVLYHGGVYAIWGRLPYDIYNLIITDAIAAGLRVEPHVVIDSAALIPPPFSVRMANCLPY